MDIPEDPDELRAFIDRWLVAIDAQRVAEMEEHLADESVAVLAPDEIVLYGFDGQVDAILPWPDRPTVLLRPIPPKLGYLRCDEPPEPTIRTAKYRRVGESTYERSA